MNIRNTILLSLFLILTIGCSSSSEEEKAVPKVTITSPEEGYIYINGIYRGHKTPKEIILPKGKHVIGVAMDASSTYLRKEITVGDESINVDLMESDKPEPKIWKGLWIGINEVSNGTTSTSYSKEELDKAYEYFLWSIKEHFEAYSYNTIKWEITRKDIIEPVMIDNDGQDAIWPSTIGRLMPEIKPGVYDNVFSFWRQEDDDCKFEGRYFALAWLKPYDLDFKTGYVTVKFDNKVDETIDERLNWYKSNDPGVYCHEWLHTVGEYFFQSKGVDMPRKPAANNLMVHAADHIYGYTYPWLTWYQDVMSGRVKDGRKYVGIGPENFLKYTIRESALEQ